MKRFLILVLLSGCSIDRWVDQVEIPANQVWDLYTELHVIQIDCHKRYQLVTALPYGKPYPKYSYQWNDYDRTVRVGDIIPLTDSLRSQIDYKRLWKKY